MRVVLSTQYKMARGTDEIKEETVLYLAKKGGPTVLPVTVESFGGTQ